MEAEIQRQLVFARNASSRTMVFGMRCLRVYVARYSWSENIISYTTESTGRIKIIIVGV